jgi:hypothetical protein
MCQTTKFDVTCTVVEIPNYHWCNGTLSVRGPDLPTGNEFAVARHIEGRNLRVMTSEELLLVGIIDVLNDYSSSCSIDEGLGLHGMIVDCVEMLASEADEVL